MTDDDFERLDALMKRVCVDLGYCGSEKRLRRLHVLDLIPNSGPVSAGKFAEWVLLADGANVEAPSAAERQHLEVIALIFKECMGAKRVDASKLKYNDDPVWP